MAEARRKSGAANRSSNSDSSEDDSSSSSRQKKSNNNEQGNPFLGGGGNGQPQWGLILTTIATTWVAYKLTSPEPSAREITWQEFRAGLLDKGLVQKLVVVNRSRVKVYLNSSGGGLTTPGAGAPTGAMSWSFLESMHRYGNQTYLQILQNTRGLLKASHYSQIPQLSVGQMMDLNQPLFI